MKYKILLATSILATVQFYAHGAEGGAAAATDDLAVVPAVGGAPRLLTVNDFTPEEIKYIYTDIIMEDNQELAETELNAFMADIAQKTPLNQDLFVRQHKQGYRQANGLP